jgi:tRNA G26 N,N-dimethylase Trm1
MPKVKPGTKHDNANAALSAKVAIRRAVMDALGEPARVFEAFAGTGVLYRAIWREAASYVGCDLRYFRDGRKVFVADNRRVMRVVDLGAFNLFDLDAYGSPWEQAVILAARRKVAPGGGSASW